MPTPEEAGIFCTSASVFLVLKIIKPVFNIVHYYWVSALK